MQRAGKGVSGALTALRGQAKGRGGRGGVEPAVWGEVAARRARLSRVADTVVRGTSLARTFGEQKPEDYSAKCDG